MPRAARNRELAGGFASGAATTLVGAPPISETVRQLTHADERADELKEIGSGDAMVIYRGRRRHQPDALVAVERHQRRLGDDAARPLAHEVRPFPLAPRRAWRWMRATG